MPGLGRFLDAWAAPSNAGDPVGCLATSFTFDTVFFEEECLGRFAGIRTGSFTGGRGLDWIIEREDRLSQIKAIALIDKAHCRGPRSPRWDLLCARGRTQSEILHAKLSLLIWARHIRLIIASANLTPSGYRKNREVFMVFEGGKDFALHRQAWLDALSYLQLLLPLGGFADHPAVGRANTLIAQARTRVDALARVAPESKYSVQFHGVGSGLPNLFEQLSHHWQESRSVAREIYAVSPFFDPKKLAARKTSGALWEMGAQKGELHLHLSAPMIMDGQTQKIQAPAEWGRAPRSSGTVKVFGVEEEDASEKERRPLHAKLIGLANETWELMAVGSSNLTQAGTGLSPNSNWEAMTSILLRPDKDRPAQRILNAAREKVSGVEVENPVFQGAAQDLEEDEVETHTVLPVAFQKAIYRRAGVRAEIVITLEAGAPKGWELRVPGKEQLATEADWRSAGCPRDWVLAWTSFAPPSGLEVCWAKKLPAWLPVCALDGNHLPPPDELIDLPLDLLVQVLTAARPLTQTVTSYLRRNKGKNPEPILENDPHKRVDVSAYLIPRTRRISLALSALREKLSEPAATLEALHWRLEGPFGALAVAEAVAREAKNADEKIFFISELCLELAQAKPIDVEGCIPSVQQVTAIKIFVRSRVKAIEGWVSEASPAIKKYAAEALAEAMKSK